VVGLAQFDMAPERGRDMRGCRRVALRLLFGASVLHAGCSSDGFDSSALTGGNFPTGSVPVLVTPNAAPAGRPAQVAFISACAKAYGIAHDPAKLRAAYLAYEGRQSGILQVAAAGEEYDATYSSIGSLDSSKRSSYCAAKHGDVVGMELRRFQAGYFEERPTQVEQAFDRKTFWTRVE